MNYFAYGSNMSLARLRARVPSAVPLGRHVLPGHELRFHKVSKDGSGKCDAFRTDAVDAQVFGMLFRIDPAEKPMLDAVEGLGWGYASHELELIAPNGGVVWAHTYIATRIDQRLQPYSWYLHHVLTGAREAELPEHYIEGRILSVTDIEDTDALRAAREHAFYS
jgi:hypothetical protein